MSLISLACVVFFAIWFQIVCSAPRAMDFPCWCFVFRIAHLWPLPPFNVAWVSK
ncbi:hypothetical protein MANES_01G119001v8 [Manihot esculenta]|uniref:Uncharacterized protein n=1 Tax=Manihot esculenta TaxID=3983 RepID=A0ACB7ICE5_MANES|nr:hypothetical protein MANES_01G119001v8 [Manihot esculenta]